MPSKTDQGWLHYLLQFNAVHPRPTQEAARSGTRFFMLTITALLLAAFLFGGMMLYSFGFAAFLFSNLPAPEAGAILRKAFPVFYLWCIAVAGVAAGVLLFLDSTSALLMAAVAITTVPARQNLMPAINAATDAGDKSRFKLLHGASVLVGVAQMAAVAYVLTRLIA